MTRVLIASAAYGGQNVGDDAILAAMVGHLRAQCSDIQITAVTREPVEMAERLGIKTLEFIGVANRVQTYRAISRMDAVIVGGGALIAEYTKGWKGLVTGHPGYPMTMLAVAQLLRKKTMVYGAGVEKIESPAARFLVRHFFGRADLITLRDEDSHLRLVNDLGIDSTRVVTTADPVLGLEVPSPLEMDKIAHDLGLDDDPRPLAVINFAYGIDRRPELLDFIAQSADYLISKCEARVLFIPMNIQATTDRAGMELVHERMRHPESAQILPLPYAHREVISIVRRADMVLSSRMHLLIFAALVSTPILGISRVPKVDAFLDHYGMSAGASTQHLDFAEFQRVLEHAWSTRSEIRARLEAERIRMGEIARSNAKYFEEIL